MTAEDRLPAVVPRQYLDVLGWPRLVVQAARVRLLFRIARGRDEQDGTHAEVSRTREQVRLLALGREGDGRPRHLQTARDAGQIAAELGADHADSRGVDAGRPTQVRKGGAQIARRDVGVFLDSIRLPDERGRAPVSAQVEI